MLEFIRTHKNLFSILFVISGAALVISMFADPYTGQMGASANLASGVAARVDGEEITVGTLFQAVQRQREQLQENMEERIAQSPNKAETRKFMEQLLRAQVGPERVLAELVNEKFLIHASELVGIDVPPAAVVDILQHEPYFQKDGKFDPLRYKQVVSQPGLYEKELRQRAKQVAFNRAVVSSLSLMSPEEQKFEAILKKKTNFELLTINPQKFQDVAKATPSEVKTFVDDASQLPKMQSYFDRNISKYKKGEEVHARHILIKEDEGGDKKASEILADIKAKKITFEDAARKFSSDKSNSEKGGDLGFFPRGVMDPAFESATFSLKADNDLSDKPVKSSFGYHLIQRIAKKADESKSLNDVKTEIAEILIQDEKKAEKAKAFAQSIIQSGKVPSEAELKKLGFSWSPTTWSPLDSSLGAVSADDYRAKLMALNASNVWLKDLIPQGENFVVVKWAAAKKADAKDAATSTPETPTQLSQEKAFSAMQFFLKNSRERLEKAKKIVRNDSVMVQLKEALGDTNAAPLGR